MSVIDPRLSTVPIDTNRSRLLEAARGASGTLALRVAASGMGLAGGILMARLLGSDGMGVLAYAAGHAGPPERGDARDGRGGRDRAHLLRRIGFAGTVAKAGHGS